MSARSLRYPMTQFSLKLLALLCMLSDHLAKVVLSGGFLIPYIGTEANLWLRTVMIVIGRIAFPIFAWFTAEGCRKTKNPTKYLQRLLIFAILSEAPFQLCFYGAGYLGFQVACHNVIFTMLLGALAIFGGTLLKKWLPDAMACLLPALIATALGWILYTDYNAWGVALIVALYYLPTEKGRLLFLLAWSTVFQLIWHGYDGNTLVWLTGENNYLLILQWFGMLFSVGFLATYNGQRGRNAKWLFYIFYPAHLLILYFLRLGLSLLF